MGLVVRLKHEPEAYVVAIAVATIGERLTCIAIAEVVHPIVPNGPSMPNSYSARVTPDLGRNRVRQISRSDLRIAYVIQPDENVVLAVQVVVKTPNARVQPHRRWGIKTEAASIELVSCGCVVCREFRGRVS